ncbi:hypothetical protein Naga_100004g123 [Nannochloropsis gaditana]|uniref:Uncharacterized protein n=1 Tax=Nannochloropsis gaditana TaxID=72520 RepID=W7TQ62_9STRA|nr:hypothetical protein Naga_100004g123 [Nannochloropsis gaditana]
MFPLGNKTAIDAVISKDDTGPSNNLACPLDNFARDKVKDMKDLYEKQLQYDFSGYVQHRMAQNMYVSLILPFVYMQEGSVKGTTQRRFNICR